MDSDSDVLIEEDNFVEDFKKSTSLPRPKQVSLILFYQNNELYTKGFKTVSGRIVLSPSHSLFCDSKL